MHFQKNSLIIFIDEGDAGFHPKWNKLYLKWILDFLNAQPEPLKFQLIFSTHSPYLLSDLAPENIVLLKRGPSNSTEIVPQDNFESFGANIHELLADSFFLEGAHIGQLAKKTIYKILDQLSGEVVNNPFTESEILRIIDKIGEPWVKSRLLEKFEIFSSRVNNL